MDGKCSLIPVDLQGCLRARGGVGIVLKRGMTLIVLFGALLPLALSAGAAGRFVDDDGSVHETYIEAVAAEGITQGCNPPENDRFCPDDPVTRGQMAAFLVRSLDYTTLNTAIDFIDDDLSVFEGDIGLLATAGVTLGCNPPDNDRFCPDDPVTRGQMAAFLVRAFNYVDPGSVDFTDDNSSEFEADIERLAAAGVTVGCNPPENDRYCPDAPITRGEMATFLGRALNLSPITPSTFTCTEVIGFSQTNQWYSGGESRVYSPFEDLVDDSAWQLRWFEGAEARIIANPDWDGWAISPVSACSTGPVDRVILTVTGSRGTDVSGWGLDIRDAIARVRIEVPTASVIVLQPVVGGPEGESCINGGEQVRADLQHPYIWEAILQVASESSDVSSGMKPRVDSCADFRDARGHLTEDAIPRVGAKVGDYYS
jgi:hypothetical protein